MIKNEHTNNSLNACVCSTSYGLFLNRKQTSWAVALVLLLGFVFFISGYFMGHQKAVHAFVQRVDQESLSDHIYASMYALYDHKGLLDADTDEQESSGNVDEQEQIEEPATRQEGAELEAQAQRIQETEKPKVIDQAPMITEKYNSYYAQLIGFGTAKAAHLFAHRLQERNVPVFVKKLRSKTAKGKVISWYQVITDRYSDVNQLQILVNHITAQERLNDVRIITV